MTKDETVYSDEIPGGWATVRFEIVNDYFGITQFGRNKHSSVIMLAPHQLAALIKFAREQEADRPTFGKFLP